MKNKKLLAALVALMIPVVSMAQTAFKGQLRISNERISVQGELLRVQLRVSYDDNVLNHGETLNITPVLKSGYRFQPLSSVVVNSKNPKSAGMQRASIAVVALNKRSGEHYFDYDTTVPFSEWMREASLFIESEEMSDGRSHIYEDKLFDRIIIRNSPQSSTYDPLKKGNVMTGTAAKVEWVQFIEPSVESDLQLTFRGTIPLADNRKIGAMNTRRFNEQVFGIINKELTEHLQVQGTTISHIDIKGYGAPIGNFQTNETRSSARALALKNYLLTDAPLGINSVSVTWIAEDWDSIASLIDQSDMRLRAAALDIIRSVDVSKGREAELRNLGSGGPFSQMEHYIFPKVCRIEYVAKLNRSMTSPQDSRLLLTHSPKAMNIADFYATARNFTVGSREFNDIIDLCARLFPDNAEANIDAAGVALLRGDIDKAESYLKAWSTDSRAYNNLGVCYMLRGNYAKAEVYLAMADAFGIPTASKALEYLRNIKN